MSNSAFPGNHTTTTTVTQTAVAPEIRYDPHYVRTLPGILKVVCIVVDLIGFICIQCSGVYSYHSRGSFFDSVAMTALWISVILLALYIFHVCEKFYRIPWLKIEMYAYFILTIFYLIAAIVAATFPVEAYAAAAFFGFCATVLYGYDCYIKFKAVRNGEIAQGSRNITVRQTA